MSWNYSSRSHEVPTVCGHQHVNVLVAGIDSSLTAVEDLYWPVDCFMWLIDSDTLINSVGLVFFRSIRFLKWVQQILSIFSDCIAVLSVFPFSWSTTLTYKTETTWLPVSCIKWFHFSIPFIPPFPFCRSAVFLTPVCTIEKVLACVNKS